MIGRYADAGRCISELFFVHLGHIFSSYLMTNLILDGKSLRVEDVYRAATAGTSVSFAPSAKKRIQASRDLVEEWVSRNEVVYGVTTGFGEFSNVNISRDRLEELQENL